MADSLAYSPQSHVERALPAVTDMRILEADDERSELWQR
jgi:hypothetical protein